MAGKQEDRLSRRERERRWHKELILDAAEQLFSSKGYYMTNVQEIADDAEFSVGFLYDMFENKEHLYQELITDRADKYFQLSYERIGNEKTPSDKLRAVLRAKLEFFEKHRRFFSIFAGISSQTEQVPPPLMSEDLMSRYKKYQDKLEEIFVSGVQAGEFGDHPPSVAALAIEGITNAIVGQWVHTGKSELESIDPEVIDRILFDGFRGGRRKK